MQIYNSDDILTMGDLYDLQELASMGKPIYYRLTRDELKWVSFVRGRYSIADFIDQNETDGILTIDAEEMSKALDNDSPGYGKAICLSDETALQRIFFWLYSESEN